MRDVYTRDQQLLGESPLFRALLQRVSRAAQNDRAVLIVGETGVGKELVARAIHFQSTRSRHALIPINCAAIPESLAENELFGHVRGAFTGAADARDGVVGQAAGGTLFLDEVDGLSLQTQARLLRFLQSKEYRPLGSSHSRSADVRIVAACNQSPESLIERGMLRSDFYYRIATIRLSVPALRERPDDVPLLAAHFLRRVQEERGSSLSFAPEALQALVGHRWPGNVRELEHAVVRAALMSDDGQITRELLELPLTREGPMASFRAEKARAVERFERQYLCRALAAAGGNISLAARLSSKNRRAFFELVRKHRIDVERFRALAPFSRAPSISGASDFANPL